MLNTTSPCAIEVFQNKVFIAGAHLPYNGQEYSILSYNTSKKIAPVFQGISNSKMKIANDKLFILGPAGSPVLIYYDGFSEETTYTKDFLNVDNEETIYGQENSDPNQVVITKFQNQKIERVGNTISTNTVPIRLEFYEGSLIISGHDLGDDTSNAFFLTGSNTWKSIDTGFVIYDIINFDNKILAGSDGKIMELSPQ